MRKLRVALLWEAFTATMTSKGQLTIPAPIVKRLRLKSGTKLRIKIEDDLIHFMPLTRSGSQSPRS